MMIEQSKMYWIIHKDKIYHAQGFDRSSIQEGTCWFPELGCTLWKGKHCFDTKKEATKVLVKKLKNKRAKIDERIRKLVGMDGFY